MVRRVKNSVEFIYCGCGCGFTTSKYGSDGRERKYIKGHINKIKQKGRKLSEDTIKKISESRKGKLLGEKHHQWKGDGVSYRGLHKWIEKHLPKPKDGKCMLCNLNPLQEAANITGILNREFKNWAWFCVRCHRKWDNNYEKNFKKWNDKKKRV